LRRIQQNQNPVVIKEIDTHPTLLRTLGPYDTFANPWSKARNTRSMTPPTEEKLTSSTLWSSTLPTDVGGRERERRRATDHFFCKWELINRETVRKDPSFFLCSKYSGAPPQKPPQLGPSAQQSHYHKKRKQKKI
jgi:hypothetical protein